jgi:hypothetical protein
MRTVLFCLFFILTGCGHLKSINNYNNIGLIVVDSGVESEHNYLNGFFHKKISLIGKSNIDETEHGTHVSGILKTYLEVPTVNWLVKVQSSSPQTNKRTINSDGQEIVKSLGLEEILEIAFKNNIKVISVSMVFQEHNDNLLKLIKKLKIIIHS